MTASEFVFLGVGLLLGVAAGAALVEILRARPPVPREVRVTMAHDAVPRRATTLSDDVFTLSGTEPAPGGPADRRMQPAGPPPGMTDRRTSVRSAAPMALALGPASAGAGARQLPATGRAVSSADIDRVRVPVSGGADPMFDAFRAETAASAAAAMRAPTITATMDRPVAQATSDTGDAPGSGAASPGTAASPVEPCAEQRRVADERCELATRARAQAATADEAHRAAQRAYDDHEARAERAATATDPRAIRRAKDEAQDRFRAARSGALTTEAVEAAARAWLLEINRINTEARDAAATLTREREAVRVLTLDLERIAMEAEASRIAAETADAACLAAREAVAACEEAANGAMDPAQAVPSSPAVPIGGPGHVASDGDEQLATALGTGGTPRIFRLVRGDRTAMVELVEAMAGDNPDDRRRWQIALSDLVDAILADSIAATSLEFPTDHPFWGPFTLAQDRDIASALSSLGYRFDGLGGWTDGRVPSQRDLSLAVGYAGLDPMRIRHWPTEDEMTELYRDVAVAADERLAGAAGDLTLGELVSMLGRRADGLAEVWNHWGRLRPLLLEG
ncbi:MAG: hypothetical protein OEV61_00265 [Chloroflexota bacterium]|nr:hypothetical protein [Chloroflexota bacterium]